MPKVTLVILQSTISPESERCKNLWRSLSDSCSPTSWNILLMSPEMATGNVLNFPMMVERRGYKDGPGSSASLSDTPVELLAEPSKTMRSFIVVLLSHHTMHWKVEGACCR